MTRILALDTSSEACSAALWLDGRCQAVFEQTPRQHTKLLLPMVAKLLADAGISLAQLDAIAFGRGPGSFTGLRICAGVAQGLAFGADLPLLPVSTLAALADEVLQQQPADGVLAALDARMNEIYWAYYRRDGQQLALVGEERVSAAADLTLPAAIDLAGGRWLGTGSGWQFADQMPAAVRAAVRELDRDRQPAAAAMARLAAIAFEQGAALAPEQAQPLYLRDNVALKKSERR